MYQQREQTLIITMTVHLQEQEGGEVVGDAQIWWYKFAKDLL